PRSRGPERALARTQRAPGKPGPDQHARPDAPRPAHRSRSSPWSDPRAGRRVGNKHSAEACGPGRYSRPRADGPAGRGDRMIAALIETGFKISKVSFGPASVVAGLQP